MAECIVRLARDAELRREMGQAGWRRARGTRFSAAAERAGIVERHGGFLTSLMGVDLSLVVVVAGRRHCSRAVAPGWGGSSSVAADVLVEPWHLVATRKTSGTEA